MTNEQKSIMKLVFAGNAGHERKNTSALVAGAGMGCPGPCIVPSSSSSSLSLPGTTHSGMILHSSTSLGFLAPLGVIPAPSVCSFSARQLRDVGNWGFQMVPPGEAEFVLNLQDTGEHSHSREGALEATFPFPKGLGHVWKGNGLLIRWLENLYHRSLQIHSSSPIERTTLQK